MTLKGFGSVLDDDERTQPLPGTMAHLMWVEKKKKLEAESVDKSLLISDELCDENVLDDKLSPHAYLSPVTRLTSSDRLSVNDKLSPNDKRSRRTDLPRLVKLGRDVPVTIKPQPIHITYNYARRDRDVIKLMASLTGDEWKVYCYLLSITHELWDGMTHCWTSHHVIREETGLGCKRTVGIVLESLEAKGLIQRTFTGNRVVKQSQYRVFLPCEIEGYTGKTQVAYTPRQRDK